MRFEFLNNISGAILLITVTVSFSILFETRYKKKNYFFSFIPFLIFFFTVNFYFLFKYGFAEYGKTTLLLATIPSLIYFFITAKHRDGRFFFTFCLVDTLSIYVALVTGILDYFAGAEGILNFILRTILSFLIPVLLYKYVRHKYLLMLRIVKKGWWLFTGMTAIIYALLILISSYPVSLRERPEDIPLAIMILILLPLIYFNIFYILLHQKRVNDKERIQEIFSVQSALMKTRAKELREAEEYLRIERHNLRHKLNIIEEFAQAGNTEQLLDYLGYEKKSFEKTKIIHYCTNPVIDVIVSHYFKKARDLEIEIEDNLNIPDELPVQPVELATVFANILENAINANLKLEKENRKLIFNCISYPVLMFEVKNPYKDKIKMSGENFPVAEEDGHGIGTRSVIAFCKKYDASYLYEAKDGWFKLMISL